jgi:hypothetical protein
VVSVVLIVVILVVALPVAVLVGLTVVAGLLGWFVKDDVEVRYEGSEHLDLGK